MNAEDWLSLAYGYAQDIWLAPNCYERVGTVHLPLVQFIIIFCSTFNSFLKEIL